MPRLIDGDKLKHAIHAFANKYGIIGMSITDFNIMLERNRVDAEPVVRCKDCRYHEHEEPGMVWCPNVIGSWIEEDGYCSRGERREDD